MHVVDTLREVIEFDWDEANTRHLARHSVTTAEFEQAMTGDAEDLGFDVVEGEERYATVGPTLSGRILFMVWSLRGERIRAVTAYDAGVQATKEWKKNR